MCIAVKIIVRPDTGTVDKIMSTGEVRHDVGSDSGNGYRIVRFGRGSPKRLHRIIWEHVNGEIPEDFEIDHIDGDKKNNKIDNLRLVKHHTNMQNLHRPHKGSTSGVKGVSWSKAGKKWQSQIRHLDQIEHLGLFESIDDARLAYAEAAARLHTHNPSAQK